MTSTGENPERHHGAFEQGVIVTERRRLGDGSIRRVDESHRGGCVAFDVSRRDGVGVGGGVGGRAREGDGAARGSDDARGARNGGAGGEGNGERHVRRVERVRRARGRGARAEVASGRMRA